MQCRLQTWEFYPTRGERFLIPLLLDLVCVEECIQSLAYAKLSVIFPEFFNVNS
jgi:hypothetical protein